MADPLANSVPLPAVDGGNGTLADEFINGLAQGGSWQFGGGPRTLTYSLDLNFDGPTQDWTPDWTGAIANAFAAWSAVANVQFVQSGVPNGQAQNLSTADLAIALDPGAEAQNVILGLGIFPDPGYADVLLDSLGYSRFGGDFPLSRPEGDVVFFTANSNYFSNLEAGSGGYYVILHEIGHALGLKHTDDDGGNGRPTFTALGIGGYDSSASTVMQGQGFTEGSFPATPMVLDILAIQHIYGANLAYRTGNDTYLLNQPNTQAIWDAGGLDTFNASGSNVAATIDLRPGEASLAGAGVRTAIAFNVTIENAIGGAGNDRLTGNGANNVLNGGLGNDTMIGGTGNDTYVRNSGGDVITELAGQGNDLVQSSIACTLAGNLERLTLMGTGHINGTGNGVANVLTGNAGNNVLNGAGGNDTINGGGGNDNLNGGAGNDSMAGGAGSDIYVRDAAGDVVTEAAGQGNDLVQSVVTCALGANLERLILTGTGNINGTGNGLANIVTGNTGNNLLNGAGGVDTLRGMGGNDTMIWNAQDALFDGGAGSDTLRVNGAGQVLNLLNVASTKIVNVEIFNITGTGNNRVELSLQDVLDLSTTTNTLRVDGNAGDTVDHNAGWAPSLAPDQVIGANTYRVYTQGAAILLVDTDITVTA